MSQPENAPGAAKPSLRERLVRRVILPLALTWMVGTTVAVGVAHFFAQKAFDRALIDDAYSVASHVKLQNGALTLELSSLEMSAVLFDQSEKVFFTVLRPDGTVIAGHPGLRPPTLSPNAKSGFFDMAYLGQSMRAVVIRRNEPASFDVMVALTQGSRTALLNSLIQYSVLPQILLLLVLGWWLRRTIARELQPLTVLQNSVKQRDAFDLTPVGVSALSSDVDKLSTSINDLLARVSHSMRAQREFSGNVAHELRTPLAGIRALAEYGLSHSDNDLRRTQLQRILESEARASRLVEQLLALALAEEGDVRIESEQVLLNEVVQDVVMRYLPRADAAGVDLGAQGLDAPVRVAGNVALVEGLLGNLIDNALRYGRAKPGEVSTVTVMLSQSANEVQLSVVDNGAGLTLDERRRLMQRGVRGVSADRLGEGAGLGLAIVAKFAKVMNARFELGNPAIGKGLRATVIFPA